MLNMENMPPAATNTTAPVENDSIRVTIRIGDPAASDMIIEALELARKNNSGVTVAAHNETRIVTAVITAPEEPTFLRFMCLEVGDVVCEPGAYGAKDALSLTRVLKRVADNTDGRRLVIEARDGHAEMRLFRALLKRASPMWSSIPGNADMFFYGPLTHTQGVLQLTPTRAMVVELPDDMSMRPNPKKSIMSGAEIGPYVRRVVELDPPALSLKEVWGRTDCGWGNNHEKWVPFLRIAGTRNWLRADAYIPHVL